MPKHIDWKTIEAAYLNSGHSLEEIAAQFGVSERAIKGKAAEGSWSARRKAQKVVPIGEAKKLQPQPESTHDRPRTRQQRERQQIDEVAILESAIVSLDLVLAGMSGGGMDDRPIDTRGIGSVAGALVKLLEYRRKIEPPTVAALAEMAIELGVSPTEFMKALSENWQQRA